jgi:anti-sigma B factor antagonist
MAQYEIKEEFVDGGVEVVAVSGYLDFEASPDLKERVARRIEEGASNLIIDLSDTSFIDSTAIGVIVGVVKRLQTHGGSLAVVSGRPGFRNLFEIIGLDEVVHLHYTREHALTALSVLA